METTAVSVDEKQTRSVGTQGLAFDEALIFEHSRPGKMGFDVSDADVEALEPSDIFPSDLLRDEPAELPEVSEPEVVRHFTRMSHWNYCIDTGFYPLGSCTMKYNPRANEALSSLPGLTGLHPYMPESWVQGALKLIYDLGEMLCEIGGLDACSVQPAAGAQGELTGLLCMRAYHHHRGERDRNRILVPDSAHGTNPASATLAGLKSVEVKAGAEGILAADTVKEHLDDSIAGIMITNPNTLGLFESDIKQICEVIHEVGGLVYCDGANMNALLGRSRPGDWGVDVMHFNLHKTFGTPHGGGGPGSGPVCVTEALEPFLPKPKIRQRDDGSYFADYDRPLSIGRVRTFYGQFLVLVRAYAYIRSLGADGLKGIADRAVLNANYLKQKLKDTFHLAYDQPCMHECIFTDDGLDALGVKTLDIAKRLIDYGFHPPTVYFPLNVNGALMIEPTESESRETLDAFVDAMKAVRKEAETDPALLTSAPTKAFRGRLDETNAARNPILVEKMRG